MSRSVILFFAILSLTPLLQAINFDDKGLPEGSWKQTCQNGRYDKNTKRLTAECRTSYQHFKKATETNQYSTSSLFLDNPQDIKDIQNHDGWLVAVLHEGGNYVLPEGNYKNTCSKCEILLTNDNSGNKVYCVRCACTQKDSNGNAKEVIRTVCHPEILTRPNAIILMNGVIALNPTYLPGGQYLKSCTECRIDIGFHRADSKGENGLQFACSCPSSTGKMFDTHIRIPDIRDFFESPKKYSNIAGILTPE